MRSNYTITKLLISVAILSVTFFFIKDKLTPVFYGVNGFWESEFVDGQEFYIEFNGNSMNIYGQDKHAKKFNVHYEAQYKKDHDGRIILRQISAKSDDQSLKDRLDNKTNILSSLRLKKIDEGMIASFFNGEELKIHKLKQVE